MHVVILGGYRTCFNIVHASIVHSSGNLFSNKKVHGIRLKTGFSLLSLSGLQKTRCLILFSSLIILLFPDTYLMSSFVLSRFCYSSSAIHNAIGFPPRLKIRTSLLPWKPRNRILRCFSCTGLFKHGKSFTGGRVSRIFVISFCNHLPLAQFNRWWNGPPRHLYKNFENGVLRTNRASAGMLPFFLGLLHSQMESKAKAVDAYQYSINLLEPEFCQTMNLVAEKQLVGEKALSNV